MALADSVPGVSGGTIAYLLGYYEEFINSLNSFLTAKGDKSEMKNNIKKSVKALNRIDCRICCGSIDIDKCI